MVKFVEILIDLNINFNNFLSDYEWPLKVNEGLSTNSVMWSKKSR